MILVIDNYDSFTYNLWHYIREIGAEVEVFRNDQITVAEIEKKSYSGIIISPGPCTPNAVSYTHLTLPTRIFV